MAAGDLKLAYASTTNDITRASTNAITSAEFNSFPEQSNNTNLYVDALVYVEFSTNASAKSDLKAVRFWLAGSVDATSREYSDSLVGDASGSDPVTPTSPPNLSLLGVVHAPGTSTTYKGGPFSIAQAFGGVMPRYWILVIENRTGQDLGTSPHPSFKYMGVYATVAQ